MKIEQALKGSEIKRKGQVWLRVMKSSIKGWPRVYEPNTKIARHLTVEELKALDWKSR